MSTPCALDLLLPKRMRQVLYALLATIVCPAVHLFNATLIFILWFGLVSCLQVLGH